MRVPTLSLLLISAVLFGEMHAASAQSPTSYPWCSRGGDGDNYNICYFTSKEQCQGTTSGVAAFCFANPYYRPSLQASDEAVNAPRRPGGERNQLPGEPSRRVGTLQSRMVQAKQSTSTGERSLGGRLDAGAAGVQVPQQETRSFSLTDVIAAGVARVVSAIGDRPETATGVRPPAALMFPGLSSPPQSSDARALCQQQAEASASSPEQRSDTYFEQCMIASSQRPK
jgi:Protein of unknown function (DUF3551)